MNRMLKLYNSLIDVGRMLINPHNCFRKNSVFLDCIGVVGFDFFSKPCRNHLLFWYQNFL